MAQEDSVSQVNKLIMWLLGALFVLMTAIGGATATRMISQTDNVLNQISEIKVSMAAQDVYRLDIERRLGNVENKLDETQRQIKKIQ